MGYMNRVFIDMSESLGLSPAQLLEDINKRSVPTYKEMVAADPQAYGAESVEVAGEEE